MALRLTLAGDLPLTPRSGYSRYRHPRRAALPRLSSYGVMTRRMTLLVLALVGLMVLVITVSPPEPGGRGGAQATVTPAPAPRSPLTDPDAFDVTAKLSTDAHAKAKDIEAVLGDRVQIVVEGAKPGSVALGDLQTEQYEPGLPARLELLAETPGAYPLVLVDENRRIGTLEIR